MKYHPQFALAVATVIGLTTETAYAGDADNIAACVNAVEAYSGKEVDEFDVIYDGVFFGHSVAKWQGITCEVSLGSVWSLSVDSKSLIVEGFSGRQSKVAYEQLKNSTEEAIAMLQSRQNILLRRLEEAEAALRQPKPDVDAISSRVEDGIDKAVGR